MATVEKNLGHWQIIFKIVEIFYLELKTKILSDIIGIYIWIHQSSTPNTGSEYWIKLKIRKNVCYAYNT